MDKQVFLNKTLTETIHKLEEEVGGLLGQEFTCTKPTHSFTSRDAHFATLTGKAILSTFEVSGDKSGTAYVIVGLKDAITLGGTLILLPPEEMESRRKKDLFDGEVCDAYGEIANIMAGVYTAVFNEYANPKLHFKKTDLAPFSPGNPNAPIPAGIYYITSGPIAMGGQPMGTLSVLIPPDLLGLELPPEKPETQTAEATQAGGKASSSPGTEPAAAAAGRSSGQTATATGTAKPVVSKRAPSTGPDLILVVSETQQAAEIFSQSFSSRCKCSIACMHFQGDFQMTARDKNVKGVILAMREVGERGLASIIKIQSAIGEDVPLIAAGPEWTRKTVLQAVKYGAKDILVTPASENELLEKIHLHMQVQQT